MYDKVCALIQWRSDLAMAGRFDDLAREFALPLVMYLEDRRMVVQSHEQLAGFLVRLQEARRASGVVQVQSGLTALELPRNGRFRIWVRHHQMDGLGRSMSYSDAVYYTCETPQGLRTEIAEFSTCSVPEIWAGLAAKGPDLRSMGQLTH